MAQSQILSDKIPSNQPTKPASMRMGVRTRSIKNASMVRRAKLSPDTVLYVTKLAELGSLNAVGRVLSCSPSQVSSVISQAESSLGIPLFLKRPRLPNTPPHLQPPPYLLTEAGNKLLPFMYELQEALIKVTVEALKLRVTKKK